MTETLRTPRFNHVAMSVPADLLGEEGRAELCAFYNEVFGWNELPTETVDRKKLVFGVHAIEQFVFLISDDPPMTAQIAKPTSRNHGRTYRDHVGTEHPLHVRGGLVEVDRHLRQRQAEREEIDLHAEHADRERNHRPDLGRS